MAVSPVKTINTVAISNAQESRDEKHREQENKKSSKNNKQTTEEQARQEAASLTVEPDSSIYSQIKSQPIDTEKVLELLAQKQTPMATKAQIQELSTKRVNSVTKTKLNKVY